MLKFEENLASRVSGALQPMLGVKVTVTAANGLLATLYADDESTVLGNPMTTDTNGYFGFKAANGDYTLTFAGAQIETAMRKIELYDADDNPPLTLAEAAGVTGAERIGGTWFGGASANLAEMGSGKGSSLIGFVQTGAGAVPRSIRDELYSILKPEQFGAVGDAVTDDTAAVLAMIAAGKLAGNRPTFYFDPTKEYAVKGRLLFDVDGTSFTSTNSRFVVTSSNSGSVFDPVIDIRCSNFSAGRIKVRRAAGVSWPRLLNIIYSARVDIASVYLTGDTQQVGYTGASNSCFNIAQSNNVEIGTVTIKNHDRAVWVDTVDQLTVRKFNLTEILRGIQTKGLTNFSLGGANTIGGSPSEIGGPGENSLVIGEGSRDGTVSNWIATKCGEHGIRLAPETDFGVERIHFTNIAIYQPGKSGVKLSGGTVDDGGGYTSTPAIVRNVHFNGVYVEDCGVRADAAWVAAGETGAYGTENEYAFTAAMVNYMSLSNFKCRKRLNAKYASIAGLRIRSVLDAQIVGVDVQGAYRSSVLISDTYRGVEKVKLLAVHTEGDALTDYGVEIDCSRYATRDIYLMGAVLKGAQLSGVKLQPFTAINQPVLLDALVAASPIGLDDGGQAFPRLYKRVTLLS